MKCKKASIDHAISLIATILLIALFAALLIFSGPSSGENIENEVTDGIERNLYEQLLTRFLFLPYGDQQTSHAIIRLHHGENLSAIHNHLSSYFSAAIQKRQWQVVITDANGYTLSFTKDGISPTPLRDERIERNIKIAEYQEVGSATLPTAGKDNIIHISLQILAPT